VVGIGVGIGVGGEVHVIGIIGLEDRYCSNACSARHLLYSFTANGPPMIRMTIARMTMAMATLSDMVMVILNEVV